MINVAAAIVTGLILIQASLTRPSVLLRDVMREQARLRDSLNNDIEAGRAKPGDWEQRLQPLKEKTAKALTSYNTAAFKDDELSALAGLFHFAELREREAEAIEAWIRTVGLGEPVTGARSALISVYVDLDRLDDASRILKSIEGPEGYGPQSLGHRVRAYRLIAFAQRDKGLNDAALSTAVAGFALASTAGAMYAFPGVREAREIEAPRLAALGLALLERKQLRNAIDALRSKWDNLAKEVPASSIQLFENELAEARLIGRPVPEIAAKQWLNGPAVLAQDYQGKVTIIEFFAMWNELSVDQITRTKEWLSKWESRGLQVIGVSRLFGRSDTEAGLSAAKELEHLEAFRRKRGMSWRIALLGEDDPTNDDRFGVTTFPMLIIVDRSGRIKTIERGSIDNRRMSRELDRLTGER